MSVQVSGPVTAARRLVVISVDDYGDGDEAFTRGVVAQVSVVTDWLAARTLAAEHRFTVSRPVKLERAEDLRRFLLEENLAEASHDEALVVYITGHGVTSTSNQHYLTLPMTDPRRLAGTAFPTRELIAAVLDSEAEHVLVLVDSCFAGALGTEVSVLIDDLSAARGKVPTLAVVTSGDTHEQPYVGEFTRLIALSLGKAADEASGYVGSHLSLADWESLLVSVGEENPGLIEPVWVWPRSRRQLPSACLPNPGYRAPEHVVSASRREVSLSHEALQYWVSRASGRVSDEDAGWYFSGRGPLMRDLVDFARTGTGVLVVTGAAGSGKSGLLARVVTLSDPLFLDSPVFQEMLRQVPDEVRPPAGAVDAAVLARAKTSLALIEDLLGAFGAPGRRGGRPPLQELLSLLGERSAALKRPVTVVIDGLDEASEPLACISDIVTALGRLRGENGTPAVRLLLGLRSSAPDRPDRCAELRDERADRLLTSLQEALDGTSVQQPVACRLLRTDLPDTVQDIAVYASALLTSEGGSPYGDEPAAAEATARLIAQAVWPSFLDARLAAAQLRAAPQLQDLADRAWQSRLESGTAALLREDLQHVARDYRVREEVLLAVMRATAFAPGSGLPWAEVWPAVTRGVLGRQVPDGCDIGEAIRVVHASRLAGYLAHGDEDGRATYRPVHQRVAEALLNEPSSLLLSGPNAAASQPGGLEGAQRTHRRIALELARLVRAAAPLPAHPYVRRHLLAHADSGGVLNDQHVPASLLAQEMSGTLRARLRLPLPIGDMSRPNLVAAALVEPYVDAGVDEQSRLSSIAFQREALSDLLHEQGMLPLAEADFSPLVPTWTVSWAQWQSRTNVLASPRGAVRTLCAFVAPDGRGLVAASASEGIGVWDSATGQRLVHIQAPRVKDLVTLAGRGGRTFLVSAARNGVSVWDPLSGRCLASAPTPSRAAPGPWAVRVLQDGDEEWVIAVLTGRHIQLWRPAQDLMQTLSDQVLPVSPADLVVVRGQNKPALLAFPDADSRKVVVWDPVSGQPTGLDMPHHFTSRALASVRGPDGHDVLVTPHGFKYGLFVWNPYSGQQAGSMTQTVRAPQGLHSLTGPHGYPVLGISHGRTMSLHDLTQPGGNTLLATVPDDGFRAVAALSAGEGRSWTVAMAGEEGIRLTVPGPSPSRRAARALGRRRAVTGPLHSLRALEWGQSPALVGVRAGQVVLTEAGSENVIYRPSTAMPVRSLQTFSAPQHSTLLAVATVDDITLWNPQYERAEGTVPRTEKSVWCTATLPDGTACIAVADPHGLSLFTADGELLWHQPRRAAWPPVSLHSLPARSGKDRIIVASVRGNLFFWDLRSGELLSKAQVPGQAAYPLMTVLPRPEGGPLLATAGGHQITLWNRAQLHATIETPTAVNVLTAVTSPRQRVLLAAGGGTGVHLWDPHTSELAHTLLTAAPVTGLAHLHRRSTGHHLWIAGRAGVAALASSSLASL